MPITKDVGRQYVLAASVDFTYSDLAAGANPAIDLPGGVTVVGGQLDVTTAFTGGVDITLAVSDDNSTYVAASDADAAIASFPVVATGTRSTAPDTVDITLAGTAPTGGAGTLTILYVADGRANEVVPG